MDGTPPLDAPSVHFAAEAMLARLSGLRTHLPGLRDPLDHEPVHQTRVASRRLRAAFALFDGALPAETLQRWDRRVRRLARALGDARDLDVQTDFLDAHMAELDLRSARPGLDRLRLRLVQRRRRAQRRLDGKLRRFKRRQVAEEIEEVLRESSVRARLAAAHGEPAWLRAVASTRIMAFVEQVLIHEPFIEQPERVEELHQMRIAAKHLRYALEIVSPLHGDLLAAPLEVVRSLQRQLGEIHDCDVWIAFVPRFVRGERRRTRRFFGHTRGFQRIAQGLEELLVERRRHRAGLHDAFVDYWHHRCGSQLWLDLRAVVMAPAVAQWDAGSLQPATAVDHGAPSDPGSPAVPGPSAIPGTPGVPGTPESRATPTTPATPTAPDARGVSTARGRSGARAGDPARPR